MFDARFDNAVIRYDRFLVIAIRGIRFRALCSRFNVVATRVFRVALRYVVANPGSSACVFEDYMVCRFFRIGLLSGLRRVHLWIRYPSLIGCRVLSAIYEDGICVYLVDQVVCSNRGVGTVRVPIVPPIPDGLSQFGP